MATHVELDSTLMAALDFATDMFEAFSENVVGRKRQESNPPSAGNAPQRL